MKTNIECITSPGVPAIYFIIHPIFPYISVIKEAHLTQTLCLRVDTLECLEVVWNHFNYVYAELNKTHYVWLQQNDIFLK